MTSEDKINGDRVVETRTRKVVAVFDVILWICIVAMMVQLDKVLKRVDVVVEAHEVDMEHLRATVISRNEMLRLIGEKDGVDEKAMDEAISLDTLAAHKPRPKRKRMAPP